METKRKRYPLDKNVLETKGFRPEIQGLRALAVFLVVIYHIWFGRVSGGVDVFLFISAFLLSLSSIRKINEGKPLAPVKYWLHVFQRLLPAASVVIIAITVASYFIYAPSRFFGIISDAFATIFYYQNWHLAFSAVDYYANNATAKTPFQHFWSLSMQGQIFLTWPLLFVLVAFLTRKLRFNLMGSAALIFGTVWTASLTYSVIETYSNQGFAYFDTRTRLWEFASGTLLALITFKWVPPQKLRVAMGWIGVLGLATCGFLLPVQQAFPGFLALWPLTSGALVILAGRTGSPWGVDRILTSRPLLKLGESSYALYLVHWPLFILYAAWADKEHVNFLEGSILIIISIILAWCLHTFVEQPVRKLEKKAKPAGLRSANLKSKRSWLAPTATIVTCLAIIVVPLNVAKISLQNHEIKIRALANTSESEDFPGAYIFTRNKPTQYRYEPLPVYDTVEQFDFLADICEGEYSAKDENTKDYCNYESYGDSSDSSLTLIVGDSHAEQAISFYRPIAQKNHQRMASYLLGGCHFAMRFGVDQACAEFSEAVIKEVINQKPENVLIMVTMAHPETNQEILIPGVEDAIEQFTKAGINVLALRDNPRYTYDMYECAQKNLGSLEACSASVEQKLAETNPAQQLIENNQRVFGIDLTDYYCPNKVCEAVIGNVYVYIDNNHISKSYGSTMADLVLNQLTEQGWGTYASSRTETPTPNATATSSANTSTRNTPNATPTASTGSSM